MGSSDGGHVVMRASAQRVKDKIRSEGELVIGAIDLLIDPKGC